ncbi:hypothetical protein Bca101_040611 [Brassica carinata]
MEATTDPSSPAFLRGVEAPSAPPTPVQVPGKGVFHRFTFAGLVTECGCFHRSALPMRNPKLLGQARSGYCLGGSGSGRRSSRFDDEALRRGEVGQVNN